ncbi:MAG TPA: sugar ABC transporter permease [Micromonosporaceae bacterium]|jgi:N,N'-diacetylchitobiose transport system permease protein|nr:sugar ABC transporter permease [Micromonosporaceae bacterium]
MSALEAPAAPALTASRHEQPTRRRRNWSRYAPYLLILPTTLVLFAVQGYPLARLLVLSLTDFTQRSLYTGEPAPWIGLANYAQIFSDPFFWRVVWRTVLFTVVNVALTILLGTGVALLMRRASRWSRTLIFIALICVWAMPQVVSTMIFRWLVDSNFGVVNWLLSLLPGVDLAGHNWFVDPTQGFAVITAVVVWGAVPFVAIMLYAGLTQVPQELEEAATVDGASPWQVFRNVTYPVLRPIYTITTTLSVIWDFQVFNQVWVARGSAPEPDYFLLGIYSFTTSFGVREYSIGAAIAVATVLMLLGFTVFYIRQSLRYGEFE